jgi:peptidoglycan/LPS O-acetylase OafA/YrhL
MKYNPALDGIRAVAVFVVICTHAGLDGMAVGLTGVDVFFVLSGFLITSLLRQEAEATGTVRFGAFYLRRVRRLYPALLAMLALYLATFPWIYPAGHHARDTLLAAFYLSDYSLAFWHAPVYLGHTWSLSVEEHFYLLWPFVVIGLTRIKSRRVIVYLLLAAYGLETWWRIWSDVEIGMQETYYRFDTRMSGLILGALLSYLPELKHRGWGWAVIPLAAITWRAFQTMPRPFPMMFAEWLAAAAILWSMSGTAKPLQWKPLVYLGTISYGIYLIHAPIAGLVREWNGPWWARLTIVCGVSFPLAHLSHKYIEARFMRPRQATTP